jgi:hypothetical protein
MPRQARQGESTVANPPRSRPMTVRRLMKYVFVAALVCTWMLNCGLLEDIHASRRAVCVNNLKQLALAMHNYHAAYGSFPPRYVPGPDGKPWHSWRVLILPFVEQQALYQGYDFNEPWDGPHNRELLQRMPSVFSCPEMWRSQPGPTTTYAAVSGPDTAFPGAQPVRIKDITDGTANTLMLVETVNAPIPWTAPIDVDIATLGPSPPGKGMPEISAHRHRPNAAIADGMVHRLTREMTRETLRALATIAGGEEVEWDMLDRHPITVHIPDD